MTALNIEVLAVIDVLSSAKTFDFICSLRVM